MNNKELFLKFFEVTGNENDSLVYLNAFKSLSPESFALIYVDSEVILEFGETLFYDIQMLAQLELFPVLLLQEDSLEYINIFYKKYENVFQENSISDFHIRTLKYSNDLNIQIKSIIAQKKIPMIISNESSELFTKISMISNSLKSRKIVILSTLGGMRKKSDNSKISIINLNETLDDITESDLNLVDNIKNIFKNSIYQGLTISIASPILLLKELFTVKGAGTFIKRGSSIDYVTNLSNIDMSRLKDLLESAFKKPINPDFLNSDIHSIILESSYRGAAIMKNTPYGGLLSKFAVDEIARGEGIGRDIWDEMKKRYNVIFWRAKIYNTVNKWYTKECQGMNRYDNWYIYWINLKTELIPDVCNYLNSLPQDFL